MTIPTHIKDQLTALQSAYSKAAPIETAPPLVFADVDAKAFALIIALDSQVAVVGQALDAFAPGNSALATAAVLTAATQSANDELDAYEMRSFIGRFAANIELTEGWGQYFATAPAITPIDIAQTGKLITTLEGDNIDLLQGGQLEAL